MYLPGQVVYDLDKKTPVVIGSDVWAPESYPKRHTHFIMSWPESTVKKGFGGLFLSFVAISLPSSTEEAQDLLDKGIIQPSPLPVHSHCWKCQDWYREEGKLWCSNPECSEYHKPIPGLR